MASAAALPAAWPQLQAALNKKSSFESTISELCKHSSQLGEPEGRALLARCRVLLRTRYTSRPFLVAGRRLFEAAAAHASGDAAYQQQLQDYIAECNAFLGEEAGPAVDPSGDAAVAGHPAAAAPALASRSSYLFEGQLSSGQQQQPPPRQPNLMDLLGGVLGQQLVAAAEQEGQQQGQQQGTGPSGQQEQEGQEQQGPSPEVLEAIERELDAIAVQLMEETGQQVPRAAPPASKKAVAALPKERLTAERLQQLGGKDVRCPVCMDDLAVNDEVQVMPCNGSHVFHPPCLAPWLQDNNSCPTCRHELPTDDQQYERRKEREREEAEERRGAENALSHNEFLYI